MGSNSNSRTQRSYTTTNVSQQAEGANIYGTDNNVFVQRADAITLDNIAQMLGQTVRDVTGQGVKVATDAFDLTEELNYESQRTAREINADSLDFARAINGDSIQLAREVAQGAEEGSKRALDFVANYSERAQVGNAGEATRTVMWVALVAGVTLIGIAWASRGGKA